MSLHKAASVARGLDKALNSFILAFAILLFVFGGYAIWDNMRLMSMASGNDYVQYKPRPDDPASYTFEELRAINPDVCGWITVDDTHIDYPVLQGEDNMEYINKDVKGDFSYSGAIFVDSENKNDFSEPYVILYGHHMNDHGMFSDVASFLDQSYFDEHRTGQLYGVGFMKNIRFIACCEVAASDVHVYDIHGINRRGTAELLRYVHDNAKTYAPEKVYTSGDVVALSTCAEAATNGRIVLFGIVE